MSEAKQQDLEEKVIIKCNNCNKELQIPKEIFEKVKRRMREEGSAGIGEHNNPNCPLGKEYAGYFVGESGGFYCNGNCYGEAIGMP